MQAIRVALVLAAAATVALCSEESTEQSTEDVSLSDEEEPAQRSSSSRQWTPPSGFPFNSNNAGTHSGWFGGGLGNMGGLNLGLNGLGGAIQGAMNAVAYSASHPPPGTVVHITTRDAHGNPVTTSYIVGDRNSYHLYHRAPVHTGHVEHVHHPNPVRMHHPHSAHNTHLKTRHRNRGRF